VTTDDGRVSNTDRRVIPFRARSGTAPLPVRHAANAPDAVSPVSDLAKFEQTEERDDYRHRMLVNAAALAFTALLVVAGVWIAESMALMRKSQDCVLMGRRSCTPTTVLPTDRWSGGAPVQQRAATDPRR
jgi:hypothetical protein